MFSIISTDLSKIPGMPVNARNAVNKVFVVGGDIKHIAALETMQLDDTAKNWEIYSNWADSIRSFPKITKQKVMQMSSWQFPNMNIVLNLFYSHFRVSLIQPQFLIGFTLNPVLAAAASVGAGEGGPMCWAEEALPSQSHRAVYF